MSIHMLTIAYEDRAAPRHTIPFLKKYEAENGVPLLNFCGHTSVMLSRSFNNHLVVEFDPKKDASNMPMRERRHGNHFLTPLYSNASTTLPAARLIQPVEADILKTQISGLKLHDIRLSFEIDETETFKALDYIDALSALPLSYNSLRSNCIVFALNLASLVGFDISAYSEKHNTLTPDGILEAFLNMARGMEGDLNRSCEGICAGRNVKISFPNKSLAQAIQEKLGIILPQPNS